METYKERVYKYIDIDGAQKSLNNKTLLFQKSNILNDPFDCYSGLINIDDPSALMDYLISKKNPEWSLAKRRKEKPKMMIVFKSNGYEEVYEKQRKRVSIASFSKKNNIALMWSYYCKSHTGITIGYEIPKGLFFIPNAKFPAMLFKVSYMKNIEKIKFGPGDYNYILKWVTTKSFEWEHEQEIRLVYLNDNSPETKQLFQYDPSIIKKITFGVNTKNEDIKEILDILKSSYDIGNISLTKMVISKKLFTIEEIPFQ